MRVGLLTGEQRSIPDGGVTHVAATVEMALSAARLIRSSSPLGDRPAVGVLDEAQLLADPDRGFAWTRAILGLDVDHLHVIGSPASERIVMSLVQRYTSDEVAEVHHRKRLSPLHVAAKPLSSLADVTAGDAVVGFSKRVVQQLRRSVSSKHQSASSLYGSLPPEVRLRLADDFNTGKVDVLCATDVIGLGLNLRNIRRVVFSSMTKFDGTQMRFLEPAETQQIAGRAGRFGSAHGEGIVTALTAPDLDLVRQHLAAKIPDVREARVLPGVEELEDFALQVGWDSTHFSELLRDFYEAVELDADSPFVLGRVEPQLEVAALLDEAAESMALADLHTFASAPVDLRATLVTTSFRSFARQYAAGEQVQLRLIRAGRDSSLRTLEDSYKVCNLYAWLGQRFPDAFDASVALAEQVEIAEDIVRIVRRPSPVKQHGDASRPPRRQRRHAGGRRGDGRGHA